MGAQTGPRPTAAVAAYATALAVVLGIADDLVGSGDYFGNILVVVIGSLVAVWVAALRKHSEDQRSRTEFLADAHSRLDASLDYDTALESLADIAVPRLADWAAVFVVEDDRIRQVAVRHVDPAKEQIAWEFERRFPYQLDQPAGVGKAIRTGEPDFQPQVTDSDVAAGAATRNTRKWCASSVSGQLSSSPCTRGG